MAELGWAKCINVRKSGDCVPIALSVLTGTRFSEIKPAYDLLETDKFAGFEGFMLGFGMRKVYEQHDARQRITVGKAHELHGNCIGIIWRRTLTHAVALKDGELYDTTDYRVYGRRNLPRRVFQVWVVDNPSAGA